MCAVRILRQPIPYPRSILWAPTSASRPVDVAFPVFLKQSALQAIYEHLAIVPPPGQGILGFMLGDRCECPVTGVAYSVIDAALRLNQTIYGDRSRDVITRLWKRLEGQLEAQQAHLIGWYHTHAPLPLELSAHDVETHAQHFGEPWQVAMLVGTDPATPAGAFFRAGSEESWVRTPQPFYELLNEDSVRPGGKKRSFMTWKTYRAYNPPALRPGAPHPHPPEAKPAEPPPPARRKSAPYERPPEIHEPEDQSEPEAAAPEESRLEDPSGLENMPQAELEEPGRVDLTEPVMPAQPQPAEDPEEEDEWEDPGALKFLSAADDQPPPLSPRPAAFPAPPPPPAPVAATPSDGFPSDRGVDAPPVDEPAQEQLPEESVGEPAEEPAHATAPAPQPRRRRRQGKRRWTRIFAIGLAILVLVAGGVAAWQFGPSLVQGWRHAPTPDTPPRAAAPAVVPAPAAAPAPAPAPAPALARVPRPEFALLDLAGDSLARALQAYDGRVRLFDKRVLDCLSLGRGMASVERAAAGYGVQRNATRATLDPYHVGWDRDLRAGVESAARQFQRSQCQHP